MKALIVLLALTGALAACDASGKFLGAGGTPGALPMAAEDTAAATVDGTTDGTTDGATDGTTDPGRTNTQSQSHAHLGQ